MIIDFRQKGTPQPTFINENAVERVSTYIWRDDIDNIIN